MPIHILPLAGSRLAPPSPTARPSSASSARRSNRGRARAPLLEQNDEGTVCRRRMPLEKLSALCDEHEQAAIIAAN
jgi:hypothetical protein